MFPSAYLSSVRSTMLLSLALAAPLWGGCNSQQAASAERKPKPIAAATAVVGERELPNTLMLAGTLKAHQESDLAANATGRVTRTTVERGSYVRQGQTIAQLDVRMATLSASEADANVQTAQTQRSAAEEECKRYQRLLDLSLIHI